MNLRKEQRLQKYYTEFPAIGLSLDLSSFKNLLVIGIGFCAGEWKGTRLLPMERTFSSSHKIYNNLLWNHL